MKRAISGLAIATLALAGCHGGEQADDTANLEADFDANASGLSKEDAYEASNAVDLARPDPGDWKDPVRNDSKPKNRP